MHGVRATILSTAAKNFDSSIPGNSHEWKSPFVAGSTTAEIDDPAVIEADEIGFLFHKLGAYLVALDFDFTTLFAQYVAATLTPADPTDFLCGAHIAVGPNTDGPASVSGASVCHVFVVISAPASVTVAAIQKSGATRVIDYASAVAVKL